MDEINYRRLVICPKLRCEDCGATSYQDPQGIFRCVVCDHERYEVCLDCGRLVGWCECPPKVVAEPRKRPRRSRSRTAKTKN